VDWGVASVAGGTSQSWIDGSHEWLFQVSASGGVALAAARSSAKKWDVALDPLWGKAGLFTCFGLSESQQNRDYDSRTAATRASLKRFPACAINQVPLILVQTTARGPASSNPIEVDLSPPEAAYPGVNRITTLDSWSSRLMSLQYCVAVMASKGDLTVSDLQAVPQSLSLADLAAVSIRVADDLDVGSYRVKIEKDGIALSGSTTSIGLPTREELRHAASAAIGPSRVDKLLRILDSSESLIRDFTLALTTSDLEERS
jgi:hypothetical protein